MFTAQTLVVVRSEFDFEPAQFETFLVDAALQKDAGVVLVLQRNRRVVNFLPEFDLRLPRPHLHLVDLPLALLQDHLERRPVLLLVLDQAVPAQHEEQVALLGLEEGGIEVKLQGNVLLDGDDRPLLSFDGVYFRIGQVFSLMLLGNRPIKGRNLLDSSEFEDVLVLVGGHRVPGRSLVETVDYIDLVVSEGDYLLASGQTPVLLVFSADYVDLARQHADAEPTSLSLHGTDTTDSILDALEDIVFDDQAGTTVSFTNYIVAVPWRIIDRFRTAQPFISSFLGQTRSMRNFGHRRQSLFTNGLKILTKRIQIALPMVIIEQMKLLQLGIRQHRFLTERENLLQILLESGDQSQNAVALQGRLEIPDLLDENLVEVGLVILELIDEIVAKEQPQLTPLALLQPPHRSLQQLLRFLDDLVQLVQLLTYVLGVDTLDIGVEIVYLLVDQFADFGQFALDFEQTRVVIDVYLHLLVFTGTHRLQTLQTPPTEFKGFTYGLLHLEVVIGVRTVLLDASRAEFAVVVAKMRAADGADGQVMREAIGSRGTGRSLHARVNIDIIRVQKMDQLMQFSAREPKETVIQKEEYGTLVEKDKKKKKKKNKERERPKEIDEEKIKELALSSDLYAVPDLTPEEKTRYAIAENHPLKIICNNLPFQITHEEIFQYFNTVIAASNPELAVPPPIKDVEFDRAKTFAVLTMASRRVKDFFRTHSEFSYIEGTTTFKMLKPRDFFMDKYLKRIEQKNIGTDNKIYLGGLPLTYNDQQVRKICETFGKLKYFNLVRDGGVSKGYCFMEYEEHACGEKAIKALNGLPIANNKLKCHSATLGSKALLGLGPNAVNSIEAVGKPANHIFGSYLLSYQNVTNIDVQLTLQNDQLCKVPSRVVQFLNMCYPEDLYEEEIVEDLEYDIADECKKYGPIDRVVIPRPDKGCGYAVPCVGKVFVKFLYITHAKKARQGIAGRVYNKRTVVASFYPEQKFNLKEYLVSV